MFQHIKLQEYVLHTYIYIYICKCIYLDLYTCKNIYDNIDPGKPAAEVSQT